MYLLICVYVNGALEAKRVDLIGLNRAKLSKNMIIIKIYHSALEVISSKLKKNVIDDLLYTS